MMRAALAIAAAAILLGAPMGEARAAQGDITMKRASANSASSSIPPCVFPHQLHRVLFKCYVCHDSIFKMKVGANAVTMSEMSKGKFCGACHNGRTAFGSSFSTCTRCHP